MRQEAIHDYLVDYFVTNDCTILSNRPGFLKVKLTIDLDKHLMNRPFYWHYIEKIGQEPETTTLSLKTQPSEEDGEMVHLGSPRLHQIFQSTKKLAPYARFYQDVKPAPGGLMPLEPWLAINAKVSYQCDRGRDEIVSLGLNLINGTILKDFQSTMEQTSLIPKIPDYCFTLTPMIKPKSGLLRLEKSLEAIAREFDQEWAEQAKRRWDYDQHLLDKFYEDDPEPPEPYYKEREALKELYEPKIKVQMINGGLFYLSANWSA